MTQVPNRGHNSFCSIVFAYKCFRPRCLHSRSYHCIILQAQDDYGTCCVRCSKHMDRCNSIHIRQGEVHENDIRLELLHLCKRLSTCHCLTDDSDIWFPSQSHAQALAHDRFVIHEQYPDHCFLLSLCLAPQIIPLVEGCSLFRAYPIFTIRARTLLQQVLTVIYNTSQVGLPESSLSSLLSNIRENFMRYLQSLLQGEQVGRASGNDNDALHYHD